MTVWYCVPYMNGFQKCTLVVQETERFRIDVRSKSVRYLRQVSKMLIAVE